MSNYYVDFLKRRAKAFLESVQADFDRGGYDLVLFHVEQFLQLYLKHLLYRKIGDFPKTYSVVRLVKDVIKVYNNDRLKEFYKKNLETLYLLEEAYISSRYLPYAYEEKEVKDIYRFVVEVFRPLVEEILQ